MSRAPGNDVSLWQGVINWPRVYACGQRFVLIKATEGDDLQDTFFKNNWAGAKSAGLLRGAYHFFRCNVDPVIQADYFINFVKSTNDIGELPPCLDIETTEEKTKGEIVPMVKVWLDRVEAAFGRKPIIYSNYFFLKDNLSEANLEPPTWAKDYPLWLAQYLDAYSDSSQPDLPPGWAKWTFWQYSKAGHVDGIEENVVDMVVFTGSLDDLHKFAGGTIPAAAATQTQMASSATQKTYMVQAGDTLISIAVKNGTTPQALASLNNVNKKDIIPGKVLKLP